MTTLDIVVKIGFPVAGTIGTIIIWYLKEVAKTFKEMNANIFDIKLKMVEVQARYDGVKEDINTVKKDVHEIKIRISDVEKEIYKR